MSIRVFTVDEANRLLPTVDRYLNQLRDKREQIIAKQVEVDLWEIVNGEPSADSGRGAGVSARVAKEMSELGTLAEEFNELAERFADLGCYLKDLDMGLVDFYHLRNGELVWLCWKQGEPAIAYWHAPDAGFSARQPLDGGRTS